MRNPVSLFLIAALSVLAVSCNSKINISPVPEDAITGDLAQFFTMESQPIVIDLNDELGTFSLDLDCKESLPAGAEVKIGYDLIDAEGNVLIRMKPSVRPITDKSIEHIKDAQKNDEVTINLTIPDGKANEFYKAKFIRLESKVEFDGLYIPNSHAVRGVRPHSRNSSRPRLSNVGFTRDYSDYVCYSYLTDDDVRNLSPGELRILRNTIYARHGRKFKSADLKRYFSGFAWYEPRYNEISMSSLSDIERHNIELIQRYE